MHVCQRRGAAALAIALCLGVACGPAPAPAPPGDATSLPAQTVEQLAARTDPYAEKARIIVLTDIANEPDDQMSLVRLLVYANEFDIEGLVATTSTWMRDAVRPDVIRQVLGAYAQVQPNLARHAEGFPTADALGALVSSGQTGFGMDAVGPDQMTDGAAAIVRAADRSDPRPLWVLAWGGTNTLAQALLHVRDTRDAGALAGFVSRLRVYAISDQDNAGPWIRREFPALHYIGVPSTIDGDQYYLATWTGISGDRFYKNADGADFTTFADEWVDRHIRAKGPLGKAYPYPCCIHEGDTPTFLGLINNGLASAMSPTYGGWGGRYVWRQHYGDSRPSWTQGGDSYAGRENSRDTVVGVDGQPHTSDQATIWRWRTAFQNDFAARMDWTIADTKQANHNPRVVVNGEPGKTPLTVDAVVGTPLTLDATGTADPDQDRLTYSWFFYPEAGGGIPGRPLVDSQGSPAAPVGEGTGLRPVTPRVRIEQPSGIRTTVVPDVAGTAHVILAVEDSGSPRLTSYRRIIVRIKPA
jgi:hypothetical protein